VTHLSYVRHRVLGHKLHFTSFILPACLSCTTETQSSGHPYSFTSSCSFGRNYVTNILITVKDN